jgi:hypothetical protein
MSGDGYFGLKAFLFTSLKSLLNSDDAYLLTLLVDVFQCRPLIGCRKNAKDVAGGFRYDYTESQAAP